MAVATGYEQAVVAKDLHHKAFAGPENKFALGIGEVFVNRRRISRRYNTWRILFGYKGVGKNCEHIAR